MAVWGPAGLGPAPPAGTTPGCVKSAEGPGPPQLSSVLPHSAEAVAPLHQLLQSLHLQPRLCEPMHCCSLHRRHHP
eukprot:1158744-Pelagomonas_calceolata.AAC.4